jgi:hypothetical protein
MREIVQDNALPPVSDAGVGGDFRDVGGGVVFGWVRIP